MPGDRLNLNDRRHGARSTGGPRQRSGMNVSSGHLTVERSRDVEIHFEVGGHAVGQYQGPRTGQSLLGRPGRGGHGSLPGDSADSPIPKTVVCFPPPRWPFFLTRLSLYYARFNKPSKIGGICPQQNSREGQRGRGGEKSRTYASAATLNRQTWFIAAKPNSAKPLLLRNNCSVPKEPHPLHLAHLNPYRGRGALSGHPNLTQIIRLNFTIT